jgi:hypothetical protein
VTSSFKLTVLVLLLISSLAASGQTDVDNAFRARNGLQPKNPVPTAKAVPWDYVPTAASFRVVTGQVFNIDRSVLWESFTGECVTVLTNGVVIQMFGIRRRPGAVGDHVSAYERVPLKKIFVRNYPQNLMPTTAKPMSGMAMLVGTIQMGADTLELWDYGTPNIPRAK